MSKKPVDYIVVNGCECEPYLTADHRLMLEAAQAIICGVAIAQHAAGAKEAVIAIEGNKMDAIAVMKKAAEGTSVQIAIVKTQYPMGGEKQMVKAVTDRQIMTGCLPLDVGVVVINVGTAAADFEVVDVMGNLRDLVDPLFPVDQRRRGQFVLRRIVERQRGAVSQGFQRQVSGTIRIESIPTIARGQVQAFEFQEVDRSELFDVDDYGEAMLLGDGGVAPELEEKARLAASNCPEYAITITE